MPNVTVICYLSSLLFYGLGYLKTLVIQNAVTLDTYDYTFYVSLATGYFVLAIVLAVIGSLFFYVKNKQENKAIKMNNIIKLREEAGRKMDDRRRASIFEIKAQLRQSECGLDLDKMMSS